MNKILTLILISFSYCMTAFGQLNTGEVSHLPYDVALSNIWGWTAPDGTEYALVGVENGTSIVSLADPANPVEVFLIPGQNSIWREIRTFGNYAYVGTDQPGTTDGLLIIDLTNLPNSAPYYHWNPDLPGLGVLNRIHTVNIDEFGVLYLNGSNLNGGGVIFVDVATDPISPIYLGNAPSEYCHDSYGRDNILYAGELYNGSMTIYDISDKSNVVLLAQQPTPNTFTHNVWLSDDSNVAFTTDERPSAYVAAYDISDLNNIIELDRFRPAATLNTTVIPHNVLVLNDWLIVSYYTDGCIIVDASKPDNLVEVGNFDTYFGADGGFSGAWGVYPYFPSGTIIVSDINTGLWVITPNYVRACWLEGLVTDSQTDAPIFDVSVTIESSEINVAGTDLTGNYKTGQATPGTFTVNFQKEGYAPKSVEATLENGVLTILDVELDPLIAVNISGSVVRSLDGNAVPDAQVLLYNEFSSYLTTCDANGSFSLNNIFAGEYTLVAGAWSYLHKLEENVSIDGTAGLTIALDKGYQDDFVFYLGWSTDATPSTTAGFWVIDKPIGTSTGGFSSNPGQDIDGDIGDQCYMTGNGSGSVGDFDVDGGEVTLTSPVMDLSTYNDPIVSYNLWFFNGGGDGNPNDELVVEISNGAETEVLESVVLPASVWHNRSEFHVADFITPTDNVTLTVRTADETPGHLVEGGIDAFLVVEGMPVAVEDPLTQKAYARAFPNPFRQAFDVNYRIDADYAQAALQVFDVLGQPVLTLPLGVAEGTATVPAASLVPGVYVVKLVADGKALQTLRLVKGSN
ncbi:MAG: choice-of-anchor B family protein [Saprospiraceae bacterium]|nr:choice-of-anchor B family protein [Saprospiraceae bacterium]